MRMRNKTQHEKAGAATPDAREERSRKADVGEAAEQTSQGSAAGKKAGREPKSAGTTKEEPVPGRVTK